MIEILKYIHIACGTLLLALGLVQIVSRKSGPRHRLLGRVYVIVMYVVCITAIYISIKRLMSEFQFGPLFLGVIAIFSLYGVSSGYLLGKFKTRRILIWGKILVVFGVLSSIALLVIAVIFWEMAGIICLVFGIFQVLGTRQDARYYLFPQHPMPNGKMYWIFEHAGRMMGSYIAGVTAFLVNVVTCQYPIVLWLGPTVIGTILIFWFNARLKKKFANS